MVYTLFYLDNVVQTSVLLFEIEVNYLSILTDYYIASPIYRTRSFGRSC